MKYYLIVNPYGGGGKGLKIKEKIQPVFESAGAELEIINTTHCGHAKELAQSLDFNGFNGICPIGGDGTMHEIINGMMLREDKSKIPIGLITGGTGNSFMHDLEMLDPIDAVKAVVGGKKQSIDIIDPTEDFIQYAEITNQNDNNNLLFHPYDTNHPNEFGHLLIGKKLYSYLYNLLKS